MVGAASGVAVGVSTGVITSLTLSPLPPLPAVQPASKMIARQEQTMDDGRWTMAVAETPGLPRALSSLHLAVGEVILLSSIVHRPSSIVHRPSSIVHDLLWLRVRARVRHGRY